MSFNKETKPEKRETSQYEQYPKQFKPDVARKLGNLAINGASKDKPKK